MHKTIKTIFITFSLFLIFIFIPGCGNDNGMFLSEEYYNTTMYIGEQLKLTVTNQSNGETALWSSSDETIATVDGNGLVEALSVGSSTITVVVGEQQFDVYLIVISKSIDDNYITIQGMQTVIIGEQITMTATVFPESANQTVIWSSSDSSIASIDETGQITGKKPGLITIKAVSLDNNKVYKEIDMLVRTGSGIQDIIENYIHNHTYSSTGEIDLKDLSNRVTDIANNSKSAIIGVTNYYKEKNVAQTSTGTAAIFKKEIISEGYYKYTAITNYHVIEDNIEIKVYLGDIDELIAAEVVKIPVKADTDSGVDLAIITFNHSIDITPLDFASSDAKTNAGDFVIAIGNPGGYTYYGSVTFGIISCAERTMSNKKAIYVQHDAPINPGNSGGPLLNLDGKIIGINTLKLVSTDIEGMGFAVALKTIMEFINN